MQRGTLKSAAGGAGRAAARRPRLSPFAWITRHLGPPPPPPHRYFARSRAPRLR